MSSFDRDATLERHQIREISLNVARRLHQVLDRNKYIPASVRPEIDASVRVITGIQRDVDQIMAGLPSDEALDFAILTHIMGGQRHALDLLEILEAKLEGGKSAYQRDSARVHQALLAVSREIEQDALRYATDAPAVQHNQMPYGYALPTNHAPRALGPGTAQRPPPRNTQAQGRPPEKKQPGKPQRALTIASASDALRAIAAKPVPAAAVASIVVTALVVTLMSLRQPAIDPAIQEAAVTAAPTENIDTTHTASVVPSSTPEMVAITTPNMEQPYLVVLTTRRSTEELQQDYRSYKASYPDLLGTAKARVDRVQGQDKETYYRLSLIPPQARDDARQLCSSLRKAGLSGCWIKPVPLH